MVISHVFHNNQAPPNSFWTLLLNFYPYFSFRRQLTKLPNSYLCSQYNLLSGQSSFNWERSIPQNQSVLWA